GPPQKLGPPLPPQSALPPELIQALQTDIQRPVPGLFDRFKEGAADLGSKFAEGIVSPSQWPEAVWNATKGGASGATMGLSELIPGMQPDPNSWAGSIGHLGGNVAAFAAGGAGLQAAGRGVQALRALQNPVVAEMVA